jgi:predicted dehydrogenase
LAIDNEPSEGQDPITGSQVAADIHAASFQMGHEPEAVAVASPTPGNAAALAQRYDIPRVFTDYPGMLKERDIDMVTITAPNRLHAQMSIDCAQAVDSLLSITI